MYRTLCLFCSPATTTLMRSKVGARQWQWRGKQQKNSDSKFYLALNFLHSSVSYSFLRCCYCCCCSRSYAPSFLRNFHLIFIFRRFFSIVHFFVCHQKFGCSLFDGMPFWKWILSQMPVFFLRIFSTAKVGTQMLEVIHNLYIFEMVTEEWIASSSFDLNMNLLDCWFRY